MNNTEGNNDVLTQLAIAHFSSCVVAEHKRLEEKYLCNAREMIVSGKGTGDLLRDYIIVITREDSKELIEVLRSMEALLSGKIGELVLFVYTWLEEAIKYNHVVDGIFGSKITMKKLFLGVLSDDKLIVNPQKGLCDFPTGKLIEGGDSGGWHELLLLNTRSTPGNEVIKELLMASTRNFLRLLHKQCWSFRVGSVAITDWMKENSGWRHPVIDMASKIGRSKDLGPSA